MRSISTVTVIAISGTTPKMQSGVSRIISKDMVGALVRLLDDFFFMPMTVGRSLHLHPLLTVIMIFVGGAVAGISGLMLVLPLLGVVMVLGETVGQVVNDPRLQARHSHARRLRHAAVTGDLQ